MKVFMQKTILLWFLMLTVFGGYAQMDSPTASCKNLLSGGYISDGKAYIGKLNANNKATFHITFFSENTYRIIGCSNNADYPLTIRVYDTDKNLLFDNKQHHYTSYWDFQFTSTVNCIIELELEADTRLKEVVQLLIGFKQK